MAYKLDLDIDTFETVAYEISKCEKYFNGSRLDDDLTQEVELSSGNTLRLEIKTLNTRVYYSRNGEEGVELSESETLPLDNYRFYSTSKTVIPGVSYSYNVTYTFKHPLEGTKPVYKRVNGGWRKQTAYERVEDMWVKISTTDTISFTIDGETWYARDGMTWSEWCNANDYSLNSWHIYGTQVMPLDNSKYIGGVTGDGKISASYNYVTRVYSPPTGDIIQFTIDEKTYYAEYHMTWSEWVDSAFNTIGAVIVDGEVKWGDRNENTIRRWDSLDNVLSTDLIRDGGKYICSCCFVAGTPVLMEDGTKKAIETVKVGDKVLSYNEETRAYESGCVVGLITNTLTTDMARLNFADGTSIEMNAYHPIGTVNGWKSLTRHNGMPLLEVGDLVITASGETIELVSVERWNESTPIVTYNLNIEDNDNYFVGDTPVLVHNAGCK